MTDQEHSLKIRHAYMALIDAIDDGTKDGLEIRCSLDASDRWGSENKVRTREVEIIRRVK